MFKLIASIVLLLSSMAAFANAEPPLQVNNKTNSNFTVMTWSGEIPISHNQTANVPIDVLASECAQHNPGGNCQLSVEYIDTYGNQSTTGTLFINKSASGSSYVPVLQLSNGFVATQSSSTCYNVTTATK